MVPCLNEGCPICATGLGVQARYVFSVVEWESRRIGLLELGRGHALQIQDWMAQAGELRGMSISIVRSSGKKQSALEVHLVNEEVPIYFRHMQGPDVVRALKQTFEKAVRSSLEASLPGDVEERRTA
jgi:hypothetical protein